MFASVLLLGQLFLEVGGIKMMSLTQFCSLGCSKNGRCTGHDIDVDDLGVHPPSLAAWAAEIDQTARHKDEKSDSTGLVTFSQLQLDDVKSELREEFDQKIENLRKELTLMIRGHETYL